MQVLNPKLTLPGIVSIICGNTREIVCLNVQILCYKKLNVSMNVRLQWACGCIYVKNS